MKLVFDFSVVEDVRPSDFEYCLFILKGNSKEVFTGCYYKYKDSFIIDDMNEYEADKVLYWANNSL